MSTENLDWLQGVLGNIGCILMGCGSALLALVGTMVGIVYLMSG